MAATLGARFVGVVEQHRALIDEVIARWGGHRFGTGGDSVHVAFRGASGAIAAALDAQRALAAYAWPDSVVLKVRMGIHTGEADVVAGDYIGLAVHEAARIADAGHGGQILVSKFSTELAGSTLPDGSDLRYLGQFTFRGIIQPHDIFQVVHPDLRADFGPLRTRSAVPNNLPAQVTSFVGRADELASLAASLGASRALTIHGPGGAGKTRLAIEAASAARDRFPDGVWFVDLAPLQPDGDPASSVAAALGLVGRKDGHATVAPVDLVTAHLAAREALLVLDNCEHVIESVAALVDGLLRAAPDLAVLATSQRPLDIAGEEVVGLAPLSVEADEGPSDAVRLFLERARRHDASFQADDATLGVIAEICARLDGLPLAIELAAAHVRAASVEEIAERLGDRLAFLTKGSRSQSDRQRTLRSTIDWGFGLLADGERLVLSRLSVFSGGLTLEAAESVCSGDGVDAEDLYTLLSSLVDRSLVVRRLRGGRARYYLLETIKEYATEKLAAVSTSSGRRAGAEIVLRREGEVWSFEHPNGSFHLKDSKGLRYLAILVGAPGRDFFVMDLIDAVDGADRSEAATRRAIGDAGAVTDAKAVGAYRDRLRDLASELEEARAWNDVGRIQALEAESESLTRELSTVLNVRGEIRGVASATERGRMSVTKAIRSAIDKIAEQAPDLGKRLRDDIRTGARCGYVPLGVPLAWEVAGP